MFVRLCYFFGGCCAHPLFSLGYIFLIFILCRALINNLWNFAAMILPIWISRLILINSLKFVMFWDCILHLFHSFLCCTPRRLLNFSRKMGSEIDMEFLILHGFGFKNVVIRSLFPLMLVRVEIVVIVIVHVFVLRLLLLLSLKPLQFLLSMLFLFI